MSDVKTFISLLSVLSAVTFSLIWMSGGFSDEWLSKINCKPGASQCFMLDD